MASFNKVILIGNMVADPELKKTPSGTSVCSFKIAVGRRIKSEGQPQADFIDIVAWRGTAEFVCRYFSKGKPILVCGQLQVRQWTDQNGQKRYSTEVVADECTFVESKSNNAPASDTPSYAPSYAGDQGGFEDVPGDDDLPF